MHAVQINFLPSPQGCAPSEVFERWPSLVDIPEAAASAGTRVSVIQAAARQESVTYNGIDYHFVDIGGMDVAARARAFTDVLVQIEPDVLHVHGLGFAEDAFALSQRLPQLPLLIQDHADRLPRWWRRPRWRRWYSAASGAAFTALEQAQSFKDAGMFGPQVRLFAIPESSSRFTPGARARACAESGMHGDPSVLWVGHLNSGKDPLTVLDGVAKAASRLPGLQLWCAFGDAPMLDEVRHRIDRDPQLRGHVHLLGKVAHAQVQALMRSADLFVSGSHSESAGYAMLEALASGVAPVVTDIPSFRAFTGNGTIGHLWPRGDSARLADALVAATLERSSPERIRAHFDATLSFEAVGRQWAHAYAQVCDDRRRRGT